MQILTSIHFSNHKNIFYINPSCANSHMSVSRECSHFEPLCIHAYIHTYSYFVLWTLLYKIPGCGNSHMSMPLRVLTARASLCAQILTSIHFFQITDTFVYKPIVCNPTYVYAIASAHSSNLFIYTCIYPQIYRMMHTCIYSQASKCYIMNTFVMNRCCANSHMSFPWLVLTLRTFLYTCMCSQEYIHSPRNVDNSIKHICAFMYLFIFIYLSTACVEHSGLVICGETWSS